MRSLCVLLLLAIPAEVLACDPCALYSLSKMSGHTENTFSVALSEQFTSYKMVGDSDEDERRREVTKAYSTTQFALGYDISDRVGVQLSIPLVFRRFDEADNFRRSTETESGIGDIVVAGSISPISIVEADYGLVFTLWSGVKFPTGDSGSLGGTASSDTHDDNDRQISDVAPSAQDGSPLAHHPISVAGGSNGRALSIGTGSYDVLVGSGITARWQRAFFFTSLQYAFRSEGDFDYRFSNDLLWDAGPGYYLLLKDDYSAALRMAFIGEYKNRDVLKGNKVDGSEVTNLYFGPEILLTWESSIYGTLSVDLPVHTNDSPQAVIESDYRLRASIGYRF